MKVRARKDRAFFETISAEHSGYRPGVDLCERWHALIGAGASLDQLLDLYLAFNRFWCVDHPGEHGVFASLTNFAGWMLSEIERRSAEVTVADWRIIGQTFVEQFTVFDAESTATALARQWLGIIHADDPATRQSFHERVEREVPNTVGVGFFHGFVKAWAQ